MMFLSQHSGHGLRRQAGRFCRPAFVRAPAAAAAIGMALFLSALGASAQGLPGGGGASTPSSGVVLFQKDADFKVSGPAGAMAINGDMMVVGDPGFDLQPAINYSEIYADMASSLGLLTAEDGPLGALGAMSGGLRLIAELMDGLQDTGAVHVFQRNGRSAGWAFQDTFNNWDAAIREVAKTPKLRDLEGGRFGQAVAVADGWVIMGSPAVKSAPVITLFGNLDAMHEVGAVTFSNPGGAQGFELTGHAIADSGTWLNLGNHVAGGAGWAAASSGERRSVLEWKFSSDKSCTLHLFRRLEGSTPWALRRTFEYDGQAFSKITALHGLGDDLVMVRSNGTSAQVSVLADIAAALAAGTAPVETVLGTYTENADAVGLAFDGTTLAIGVPTQNKIKLFTRQSGSSWAQAGEVAGAAGEHIGRCVGIGGNALLSTLDVSSQTVAAWRLLADGSWQRYNQQALGRAVSGFTFDPQAFTTYGPEGGDTRVVTSNITRSFRVKIRDAAGQPVPGALFKVLYVNTADLSGRGSYMKGTIFRHVGPPRRIWVDMTHTPRGGYDLSAQAGRSFYYYLSGPDQNTFAPEAEWWYPYYSATHYFEGTASSSFLFEKDGSRVIGWSEGQRTNGYVNTILRDQTNTGVAAGQITTLGDWYFTWATAPDNQANVASAKLRIESELSPYISGPMQARVITADANGEALIEGVDKADYRVEMLGAYQGGSGVIELRNTVHQDSVLVSVTGTGSITGHLYAYPAGTGYPGIPSWTPIAGVTLTVAGQQVTTDASGSYSVTGLIPGTYSVAVPAPYVINGGNTLSVTLTNDAPNAVRNPVAVVSGAQDLVLKTSSGAPVANVSVTITGPYGYSQQMITGADGVLSLGALLPGRYQAVVNDTVLPWGAAPFTFDQDGSGTVVTVTPRGQQRVVEFGPGAAGLAATLAVASSVQESTLTTEWTDTVVQNSVQSAREYVILESEIALPLTVTFTGPCEIIAAEAKLVMDMSEPGQYSAYPKLDARPAVGLADPRGVLVTPAARTWSAFGIISGYEAASAQTVMSRHVPAAGTETWKILLKFDTPQVRRAVLKRVTTNYPQPDTLLKLTLRSPQGITRTIQTIVGADGQVRVDDLPATGALHAKVTGATFKTGTDSSRFDLSDSGAWTLAPVKTSAVSGMCRFADGTPVPRVTVRALDFNGAELAASETGLNGAYRLPEVPQGVCQIVVARDGYQFSPESKEISLGAAEATADFLVRGATRLPLKLVRGAGGEPVENLRLAPVEWREELDAPVNRSLQWNKAADIFLQGAVTVEESFDVENVRLYFEGSPEIESALVLSHPDSTSVVVQSEPLDYGKTWRWHINAWHQDDAAVPPVGFTSNNRWSWSWQYGMDYSKRTLRPLDSFTSFRGRRAQGRWTVGISPAWYDTSKPIAATIAKTYLCLTPRAPLQANASTAADGTATFEGLVPGPFALINDGASVLPANLTLMLRTGEAKPLSLRTRKAGASAVISLVRNQAGSLASPVEGPTGTTYRWFKNGTELPDTNAATLSFATVTDAAAGLYSVEASNDAWRAKADLGTVQVLTQPVFTWSPPASILQGDAEAGFFNATSDAAGAITYSVSNLSSSDPGLYTVTATFTPTDPSVYASASLTRQIRVQLPTTLQWSPPATLAPDAAFSSYQTAAGSVPGTVTYSPATLEVLSSGEHTFTATFVPEDALTYRGTSVTRTIRVLAIASFDWAPPEQVGRTGSRDSIRCAVSSMPGTITYEPADLEEAPLGTYTVTATFTPAEPQYYAARTLTRQIAVVRFITARNVLPAVARGGVSWADVDGDGSLDVLSSGETTAMGQQTSVWKNSGGNFSSITSSLPITRYGKAAWTDLDGDGKPDLFFGGQLNGHYGAASETFLYRNTGADFDLLNQAFENPAPGSFHYATDIAWGDFDHDGDADLAVVYYRGVRVYRNDSGTFTELTDLRSNLCEGFVKWLDLDGDADLDLMYSGWDPAMTWKTYTRVFANDGQGHLAAASSPFDGSANGSIDAADFDGDGDLDVLISSGYDGTHLYRSLGGGSFEKVAGALPSFRFGSVAFGDFNADGKPDVFMNGTDESWNFKAALFLNNGSGGFDQTDDAFPGSYSGGISLADYDDDGDLDWLYHGSYALPENMSDLLPSTVLVKNVLGPKNTVPTPPGSLSAVTRDGRTTFVWSAGADAETPSPSLQYNLAVWKPGGGAFVLSPLSRLGDGKRSVVNAGNAGLSRTWSLSLPPGSYRAAVQTIDGGLAASTFSTPIPLQVGGSDPVPEFLATFANLPPEAAGPFADPDQDGTPNVLEAFLGGRSPVSAEPSPMAVTPPAPETPGAPPAFTLAVPEGVTFSNTGSPTATWGGYTFTAEASTDLQDFNAPLEAADSPAGQGAAPQGFRLQTFRLTGPSSGATRGFFRLKVSAE